MNERTIEFAKHQFSRVNILGWAVIATVIAYSGPFGTYQTQSFWVRLLFWSLAVASGAVILSFCVALARRLIQPERRVLTDFTVLVLMVSAYPPVLWLLAHALFRPDSHPFPSFVTLAEYVVVVALAILVVRRTVPGLGGIGFSLFGLPRDGAAEKEQPRLMQRMPEGFEGPILRLCVRDHFVDIVGQAATHTIRFRFGDAVAEMEPVEGFYTHRSHWVARDAVDGVERKDGRNWLRLVNGDLVPVSRTYKPDLEAAGLM